MTENAAGNRDTATMAAQLTQSSSVVIGFGAVTAAAGILVLVWPTATLGLIGIVFGVFALLNGVFQLMSAIATGEPAASRRVLLALLGVLSLIAGVLCLRHLVQTLAVLSLLLAIFWVVSGVLGIVHALASPPGHGRGWAFVAGLLSLAAGIVLLAYPSATLLVLVWLLGIELIVFGLVAVASGLQARRQEHAPAHSMQAGPHPA
ncbi:HdeD family acid-resistance protein [Amycolatopsis sp.]|uniref:HdeD family acid-resistance protein n=1 Tax=Amycolatopsis sp. TaxID=37632 RepID=UPI002BC4C2A4|nr:HdeD family acid-resistance protein [Amycolatopsis sp.]HVV14537.1 HdeD family acid-resistance protein [Amycolatopsis sp.]